MFEKASGISPGRTGDVSTFDVQNHRTQGLEPRHQAFQSSPTLGPPNFEEGRVDLEGHSIRGHGLSDAQAEALCLPGRGLREHLGMRIQARHEEASTLPNPLFQAGKERGFHQAYLSLTSDGLPEGQYNARRRTQGRRRCGQRRKPLPTFFSMDTLLVTRIPTSIVALENQHRVVASEAEGVVHGHPHRHFPGFVGDVI